MRAKQPGECDLTVHCPYTECPVLLRRLAHLLQRPLCSGGPPKHLLFLVSLALQCAKIKAWVCKEELPDTPSSLPATPPPAGSIRTAKTVPTSKGSFAPLPKDSYLRASKPSQSNWYKGRALASLRGVLHPLVPFQASVCQPVSNTQAVSPSSGLPLLLLQGHFYAIRGHHVAPTLLSSLSPPPYPLLNRKHSYVPSTEGSEFLMLCTFGLPRCLVPPPHPSNCPSKEALLTLPGQVAQRR